MSHWLKCYSKSYSREYWFNTVDGTKSWDEPSIISKKRVSLSDNELHERTVKAKVDIDSGSNPIQLKVAIIVPFRDLRVEQTRGKQLQKFIPYMTSFLLNGGSNFHIYIIEQSNDNRKFNRGKLLNIGFRVACKEACDIFIFHDVDLLPSPELVKYYYQRIVDKPLHIARIWDRYNDNPNYFGGIVSFSKEMFEQINGFPNNFWGWGGEDDELYKRAVKVGLEMSAPKEGTITDLENMNLKSKLQYLKENKLLKCMNKYEVLAEHDKTWKENGLLDLKYSEISRDTLNEYSTKITVDVELNGSHWTNQRSNINDPQYN